MPSATPRREALFNCELRARTAVRFSPSAIPGLVSPPNINLESLTASTAWIGRGRASGGSGLGLSLGKWIAEQHGTSLSLESAIGRGTSFQFAIAKPAQHRL